MEGTTFIGVSARLRKNRLVRKTVSFFCKWSSFSFENYNCVLIYVDVDANSKRKNDSMFSFSSYVLSVQFLHLFLSSLLRHCERTLCSVSKRSLKVSCIGEHIFLISRIPLILLLYHKSGMYRFCPISSSLLLLLLLSILLELDASQLGSVDFLLAADA